MITKNRLFKRFDGVESSRIAGLAKAMSRQTQLPIRPGQVVSAALRLGLEQLEKRYDSNKAA
jgi:hypothetical protein